jgi:N-methylhydantoinase A/oxoprolinase/acetone carboxylase beta subunit
LAQFNIFWMNPHNAETVPMDLLEMLHNYGLPATQAKNASAAAQLKAQMQADALQPLTGDEGYDPTNDRANAEGESDDAVILLSEDLVEKAYVFLRSTVPFSAAPSVPCHPDAMTLC